MTQLAARLLTLAAIMAACGLAAPADAQTRRVAPHPAFVFASERTVGTLTVQQWVRGTSPEISPAGMCECMTVIYQGGRQVLTVGRPDLVAAVTVDAASGSDINGDGTIDVVLTDWSGGAHCCYSMNVYSLESGTARQMLSLEQGNCGPGELIDLDGDRRLEIVTCDDGWATMYCAFAFAPMPRVVLAYDARTRSYRPDTPRFAARFRADFPAIMTAAEQALASNSDGDVGRDKCAVLGPALTLMYEGRADDGLAVIRRLYRHGDRDAFARATLAQARNRPLWRSAGTR